MAKKLYLSQRTNRHIVKRLDASNNLEYYFGAYGTSGSSTDRTNFPKDIARDSSNNIYVADSINKRILKLDSALSYVNQLSLSSVGFPDRLLTVGTNLYGTSYESPGVGMFKIDLTSFTLSKYESGVLYSFLNIYGLSEDFTSGYFLLSGVDQNLLKVQEVSSGFSATGFQVLTGQDDQRFFGHCKHTDGNLYVHTGRKLARVNSSYINTGDSDIFAKPGFYIQESEFDNTLLTFDEKNKKVVRHDNNLNFVEDVYEDSGDTVATDCYNVAGLLEFNI